MKQLLFGLCLILTTTLHAQEKPIKINGNTQGTSFHITYFDSLQRNLEKEIIALYKDIDASISLYDSTSLLCRINRNDTTAQPDQHFIACYQKSIEMAQITDGAFDPTVGPLVVGWGFSYKKKLKMDSSMVDSILRFTGYQLTSLAQNKIIKKDPRVSLDFNSAGQGYTVDMVAKLLESKGIYNYIVEIGGEVYAHGSKPHNQPWKVGIEKPTDNLSGSNPLKAIVILNNKSLNTSGSYHKFFIENGIKYSHEINPKTGYPARNTLLSATILADNCLTSGVFATSCMVMGLEKSIQLLAKHPELQAYLIYSDHTGNFKIYETPGLKDLLTEIEEEK